MQKIDAHQHFWKFDPIRHSWINSEMNVIRRDFMPKDLQPLLQEKDFNGCIAVQADEHEDENTFLLELASENDFIKGVIGWVDFFDKNVASRIEFYSQYEKMKGFRYILQDKNPRDLMLHKTFLDGLKALGNDQFLYEILIFTDQLRFAKELVSRFPNQIFMLDHLSKPKIKSGEIDQWRKDISALAEHENVCCKISGMVTEADWKNWKYEDFEPYLDVVFNAFGSNRVLFGSDWPVCNLAGNYQQVAQIMEYYTKQLSRDEQEKFWGGNAAQYYQLI